MKHVAKCIYDYSASGDNEISINEEDIVVIDIAVEEEIADIEQAPSEDGWILASILYSNPTATNPTESGKEGYIPANYLQLIQSSGHIKRTIGYEYSAQAEFELSVGENEELSVYPGDYDGWTIARNSEGAVGFVPTDYFVDSKQQDSSPSGNNNGQNAIKSSYSEKELGLFAAIKQTTAGHSAITADRKNDIAEQEFDDVDTTSATRQQQQQPIDDDDFDDYSLPAPASQTIAAPPSVIERSISQQKQLSSFISSTSPTPTTPAAPTSTSVGAKKLFPTTAVTKIGKKIKNRDGLLSVDLVNLCFLNDKDHSVVQEWPISSITKITRDKKTLHLEFESLSYDFAFKAKSDTKELITLIEFAKESASSVISPAGSVSAVAHIDYSDDSNLSSTRSSLATPASTSSVQPSSVNSVSGNKTKRTNTAMIGAPIVSSPLVSSQIKLSPPDRKSSPSLPQKSSPEFPDRPNSAGESISATALYDYEAQDDTQLNIQENDQLQVLDNSDAEWIYVKNISQMNSIGYVPANYIRIQAVSSIPPPAAVSPPKPPKVDVKKIEEHEEPVSDVPPPKPPRPAHLLTSPIINTVTDNVTPILPPKSPIQVDMDFFTKVEPAKPNPLQSLGDLMSSSSTAPTVKNDNSDSSNYSKSQAENSSNLPSPSSDKRPSLDFGMDKSIASRKPSILGEKVESKLEKESNKNMRTWTDRSGSFKVEAVLLGIADGKILLHKSNGVKIGVPIDKMSGEDIEYVNAVSGQNFEIPEPGSSSFPTTSSLTKPATSYNGHDWLKYFTSCSIEASDAERYAIKFVSEKMGADTLTDFDRPMLKELGVAEGDIIRILKKQQESKPATPKPVTTLPIMKDPMTQAKVLEAEKKAQQRTLSLLDNTSKPSPAISADVNDWDIVFDSKTSAANKQAEIMAKKLQEQKDEAFARELQEKEYREARMSAANNGRISNNNVAQKPSFEASRPEPKQEPSKPEIDLFNTVEMKKGVPENPNNTIRRGKVNNEAAFDPNSLFVAAKSQSSAPVTAAMASPASSLMGSSTPGSRPVNPISSVPLVPVPSTISPLPVNISSGDEKPTIMVQGMQNLRIQDPAGITATPLSAAATGFGNHLPTPNRTTSFLTTQQPGMQVSSSLSTPITPSASNITANAASIQALQQQQQHLLGLGAQNQLNMGKLQQQQLFNHRPSSSMLSQEKQSPLSTLQRQSSASPGVQQSVHGGIIPNPMIIQQNPSPLLLQQQQQQKLQLNRVNNLGVNNSNTNNNNMIMAGGLGVPTMMPQMANMPMMPMFQPMQMPQLGHMNPQGMMLGNQGMSSQQPNNNPQDKYSVFRDMESSLPSNIFAQPQPNATSASSEHLANPMGMPQQPLMPQMGIGMFQPIFPIQPQQPPQQKPEMQYPPQQNRGWTG